MLVVWLACGPAPPRALTLTLSRRAGEGMFVADEGVAAVRGWCWFSGSAANGCVGGLVGRAGLKPAPTSVGLDRWTGMGVLVVWLACGPAPPRALTPTLSRRTGEGECLWRMRVLRR